MQHQLKASRELALLVPGIASIRSYLQKTLLMPAVLKQIAASSYSHPNRFVKIDLGSMLSKHHVNRIHIWHESATGYSDVHNHRWHFKSLVLAGSLQERLYKLSESKDAQPFFEMEYKRSTLSSFQLVPTQVEQLECVQTINHRAGAIYSRDAEALHSVRCASAYAATWFATTQVNRDFSEVYKRSVENPQVSYLIQQEPLSIIETKDAIEELLSKLALHPTIKKSCNLKLMRSREPELV